MNSTITSNKGTPAPNSTYPKGGVSCSTDSFVVNQTLVFQINFCGKRPALRVAAKRQAVKKPCFSQFYSKKTLVNFNTFALRHAVF